MKGSIYARDLEVNQEEGGICLGFNSFMQVCTGIPILITRPTPSILSMNCRIWAIYPSTLSTPQTIRNTHNIIGTTYLLCTIQIILVSKIISINIVSMILARTILIYTTLDSTILNLSIVFIFQQVYDINQNHAVRCANQF